MTNVGHFYCYCYFFLPVKEGRRGGTIVFLPFAKTMKTCRSLATLRCVGTQGRLELLRHGEALDPRIFTTTARTRMRFFMQAQKASELVIKLNLPRANACFWLHPSSKVYPPINRQPRLVFLPQCHDRWITVIHFCTRLHQHIGSPVSQSHCPSIDPCMRMHALTYTAHVTRFPYNWLYTQTKYM